MRTPLLTPLLAWVCLVTIAGGASAQPATPANVRAEPPAVAAGPAATIAQLAWLAGSWASEPGATTRHEEHWTAPAGGAMVGMHRTVRGERMVEFEFLRVVEQHGSLVYLASPGGRPPTPFPLKSIDASTVVFENATHDFPQRVIYTRDGDRLLARIEGQRNGQAGSMEWRWIRTTLVP